MSFARALIITCAITADAIRLNYEPKGTSLKAESKEGLIPWHCTWNQECANYNPYENLKCSKPELARIRIESKQEKGLILSGQGGSCTRVAQKIAEIVGTYNWGDVDDVTKDSWAVRWGGSFLKHNDVFKAAGSVDYEPASALPAKLLVDVEDQVCKTLMIADRMAHREQTYHPWALKEPALRLMLPVFSEVVNFKFLHVTRDIRCIASKRNASDDSDMKLAADRDLFEKYADAKLTDESINLAKTEHSTSMLDVAGLKKALKAQPWTAEEQKWVKFAHVWSAVEKKLHTTWTEKRPDDYYMLSEYNFPSEDDTKFEKAKKLAEFLGDKEASKSTLQKMNRVWKQPECDDAHWQMMQKILTADENKEIKATMEMLGYYI